MHGHGLYLLTLAHARQVLANKQERMAIAASRMTSTSGAATIFAEHERARAALNHAVASDLRARAKLQLS